MSDKVLRNGKPIPREEALALAQVDRLLSLITLLTDELDQSREYALALEHELRDRADATDAMRKAAEALGAMPEGYCFCSKDRIGDDSKTHEPECADLRAVIQGCQNAR